MKKIIFGFFAIIVCLGGYAQDAPKTMKISEAVQIALENNVSLKQTRNNLTTNQIDKYSRLSSMGPRVTLNGNLGRNDGNSFNQQEGRVVNGQLDFVNGSLNASLPLFNGFSRLYDFKSTDAQVESQIHLIKRTEQDVIRDVANQYLVCLLDKEFLKINEQNLAVQQKQFEQLDAQEQEGRVAKVDVINQEYLVKNAELLVLRAEVTLRTDKAALSEMLQLDPSVSFDLEDPNFIINGLDFSSYKLDELYEMASKSRGDLLQAQKLEEVSRYALKSDRGTYYPNVQAFFNYGSAYNQIVGTPDSVSRNFDQQFFSDNVFKTYGLSISIPIFTGLTTRSQVVRSRISYENAKLTTSGLNFTVKSEVLNAHNSYRDAIANYEASQSQLDAAKLSYDLESERRRLGASDIVAYSQANRNYLNAQATFAQARYTLMFQEILLNYAVGTLQFEDIE